MVLSLGKGLLSNLRVRVFALIIIAEDILINLMFGYLPYYLVFICDVFPSRPEPLRD